MSGGCGAEPVGRDDWRPAMVEAVTSVHPDGLAARLLTPADAASYLDLTRRAADFYEDYDGGLPTLDEVAADMAALPPGAHSESKATLGVFREDVLVAYLDLLAGYPDEATWFLGLLLVADSERGSGLGTAVVTGVAQAASDRGATCLALGVYDANAPARAFWTRQGFRDDRHLPDYRNPHGQLQPVTRLVRPLGQP